MMLSARIKWLTTSHHWLPDMLDFWNFSTEYLLHDAMCSGNVPLQRRPRVNWLQNFFSTTRPKFAPLATKTQRRHTASQDYIGGERGGRERGEKKHRSHMCS